MQTELPITVGSRVSRRDDPDPIDGTTVHMILDTWLVLQESPIHRPYVGGIADYQRLLEAPEGCMLISSFSDLRVGDLVYDGVTDEWVRVEPALTDMAAAPGFMYARPIIGDDYEYVPYDVVLAEARLNGTACGCGCSGDRRCTYFADGRWMSSVIPSNHLAYRRKTAKAVARDKAAEEAKRPIAVGDTVRKTDGVAEYRVLAIVDEKWMVIQCNEYDPQMASRRRFCRVATK